MYIIISFSLATYPIKISFKVKVLLISYTDHGLRQNLYRGLPQQCVLPAARTINPRVHTVHRCLLYMHKYHACVY